MLLNAFSNNFFISFTVTNAQKKSVIAHMTNTKGAVKWGLDKGANGVELDLVFTRNGFPSLFRHGGICDCSCVCPVGCTNQGVCSALWKEVGSHCGASTSVCEMFSYLGSEELREKLAIIYIDSKMVNSMKDYYGAGGRVVNMLDEYVFEKGFKGNSPLNFNVCQSKCNVQIVHRASNHQRAEGTLY